jgi:hypothetical protein
VPGTCMGWGSFETQKDQDRAEIIGGTSIVYRGSTDAYQNAVRGTAALYTVVLLSEFCCSVNGLFRPWYQMRIRHFCVTVPNERILYPSAAKNCKAVTGCGNGDENHCSSTSEYPRVLRRRFYTE